MFLWGWNMREIPPPRTDNYIENKSVWEINFNSNLFFNLREITNSSLFVTEKGERGEEMMSLDVSEL